MSIKVVAACEDPGGLAQILSASGAQVQLSATTSQVSCLPQLVKQFRPDVVVLFNTVATGVEGVSGPIMMMNDDESAVLQSLSLGVKGAVGALPNPSEFEACLRALMEGEAYVSPEITARLVNLFQD